MMTETISRRRGLGLLVGGPGIAMITVAAGFLLIGFIASARPARASPR